MMRILQRPVAWTFRPLLGRLPSRERLPRCREWFRELDRRLVLLVSFAVWSAVVLVLLTLLLTGSGEDGHTSWKWVYRHRTSMNAANASTPPATASTLKIGVISKQQPQKPRPWKTWKWLSWWFLGNDSANTDAPEPKDTTTLEVEALLERYSPWQLPSTTNDSAFSTCSFFSFPAPSTAMESVTFRIYPSQTVRLALACDDNRESPESWQLLLETVPNSGDDEHALLLAERNLRETEYHYQGGTRARLWTHDIQLPRLTAVGEYRLLLRSRSKSTELSFHVSVQLPCADYSAVASPLGTWKNVSTIHSNRWCTQPCLYSDFLDPTAHQQQPPVTTTENRLWLRNTSLLFMGNSHIRNLFRCTTHLVSQGQSLVDGPPCDSPQNDTHCLSCQNLVPVHRHDYQYHVRPLDMELQDYWTLLWDADDTVRRQCNASTFLATSSEMECITDHISSNVPYTGIRIGVDFLYGTVFPRMRADPQTYLLLNVYIGHNAMEYVMRLVESILQYQAFGVPERVLLVVDETAGPSFDGVLDLFRRAGLKVLDLRPVYQAYERKLESGELEEDQDGPPTVRGHLYGPLQKLLVQHVLTNIAYLEMQRVWKEQSAVDQHLEWLWPEQGCE